MDKSKSISNIIKLSIVIGFALIFVILFAQYIAIAQMNAKNEKLSSELSSSKEEYEELSKEYDNIAQNYEQYVEDYMRDNHNYVHDEEVLFNK